MRGGGGRERRERVVGRGGEGKGKGREGGRGWFWAGLGRMWVVDGLSLFGFLASMNELIE